MFACGAYEIRNSACHLDAAGTPTHHDKGGQRAAHIWIILELGLLEAVDDTIANVQGVAECLYRQNLLLHALGNTDIGDLTARQHQRIK